jgi:hypothetical protein
MHVINLKSMITVGGQQMCKIIRHSISLPVQLKQEEHEQAQEKKKPNDLGINEVGDKGMPLQLPEMVLVVPPIADVDAAPPTSAKDVKSVGRYARHLPHEALFCRPVLAGFPE